MRFSGSPFARESGVGEGKTGRWGTGGSRQTHLVGAAELPDEDALVAGVHVQGAVEEGGKVRGRVRVVHGGAFFRLGWLEVEREWGRCRGRRGAAVSSEERNVSVLGVVIRGRGRILVFGSKEGDLSLGSGQF